MKFYYAVVTTVLVAAMLGGQGQAVKRDSKRDKESANHTVTDIVQMEFKIVNHNGEGDDHVGTVDIGLFGEDAPITVINFKQLCEGVTHQRKTLKYADSPCHRVVKDMLIQCGDIVYKDGRGSMSSFGNMFRDENFKVSHSSGGIVSMANQGKDTNGSQFFILFNRARYLDEYHVAFGKVLKGMDTLDLINELGPKRSSAEPLRKVTVESCKVKNVEKKFTLTEKQMRANNLEA